MESLPEFFVELLRVEILTDFIEEFFINNAGEMTAQITMNAGADSSLVNNTGTINKIVQNAGNDSNLLIVFYVQIMPDDFVMQLHRF